MTVNNSVQNPIRLTILRATEKCFGNWIVSEGEEGRKTKPRKPDQTGQPSCGGWAVSCQKKVIE